MCNISTHKSKDYFLVSLSIFDCSLVTIRFVDLAVRSLSLSPRDNLRILFALLGFVDKESVVSAPFESDEGLFTCKIKPFISLKQFSFVSVTSGKFSIFHVFNSNNLCRGAYLSALTFFRFFTLSLSLISDSITTCLDNPAKGINMY